MEVGEDQELALFQAYPCAYYVQSPSTISHANSTDDHIRNTTTLSHSSSRGSNHYLTLHHHEKKISYDARSHGTAVTTTENGDHHLNRLIIVDPNKLGHLDHDHVYDDDDDEGQEDYDYYEKRYWWKRYCSYRNSDSFGWICLQIGWRAIFSFWVALLVFYIATKPPPPMVSIKVAGVREFGLAEGVDGSGVTTKMLTCNCTINLIIHNKSKLFGLHIPPPIIQMAFGRLPVALTHGPKLYAESGTTRFELYVGTRNKPMYGAGRSMEDMLDSGKGLPVVIRLSFSSNFRVFWKLVKPKFRHHAQCLLVLDKAYDKKHRTQSFNSTCTLT